MKGNQLLEISSFNGNKFRVSSLSEAEEFCKKIALGHYENFPVASFLLPKAKRNHIFNIYAFARISDDIADTLTDLPPEERIKILDSFIENLKYYAVNHNSFGKDEFTNPVLIALASTINKLELPILPFEKLITAFKMDSSFTQAENWDDLMNYCKYSANPVGELVLRVFNLYNEQTAYLSDCICSGLQLTNFWQDLSVDIPAGRLFIPKELTKKYLLEENSISENNNAELLSELYNYTENLFEIGKELVKLLTVKRLQIEISITVKGGITVLKKCKDLKSNIFFKRPKLGKFDLLKILFSKL